MYTKILEILEKSEMTKRNRIFYILFLPITATLEYLCFRYFNKIIQNELYTNDEFIAFLDKNEFGYKNNILYKMDVVDSEYHQAMNAEDLKNSIRNEVNNAVMEMIAKITNVNVEELLSIIVQVFPAKTNKKRHYKVSIQYFRYLLIVENKKFLVTWFFTLAIILTAVYITFKLWL